MEWGFVLGLVAVTLAVIGLVIYFGLKLSRAMQKHSPNSEFVQSITLSGTALFASMVAFWIICAAARELKPQSSLGAFLGTVEGVIAVFVASIFFISVAGAILEKLGYPIMKRDRPNGHGPSSPTK